MNQIRISLNNQKIQTFRHTVTYKMMKLLFKHDFAVSVKYREEDYDSLKSM